MDYIVAHSGRPIWEVFEEMLNEPRIEAAWSSRLSGASRREWTVVAGKADDAIARMVADALENLDGFQRALEGLLHAIPYGHSIAEVIWEEQDGRLIPRAIKEKRHEWFRFDVDGRLYFRRPGGTWEAAPPYKFIVHSHRVRFGDPRGKPVLVRCYWPWYVKRHASQFWAMFVEKFGDPSLIAKGVPPALKDEVLQLLLNLRQGGAATLPPGVEVDTLTVKTVGAGSHADLFSTLLEFCDKEMTLAFLGQTLTTEVKEGSYAAARVHLAVRRDIIESDIAALEDTLNSTLIPWIVDLNVGPQKAYPYIRFQRDEEIDLQAVKTAWEMGYPIPLDEVQRISRIRRAAPGEETLPPPPQLGLA
jgi:phage gp29-like protein